MASDKRICTHANRPSYLKMLLTSSDEFTEAHALEHIIYTVGAIRPRATPPHHLRKSQKPSARRQCTNGGPLEGGPPETVIQQIFKQAKHSARRSRVPATRKCETTTTQWVLATYHLKPATAYAQRHRQNMEEACTLLPAPANRDQIQNRRRSWLTPITSKKRWRVGRLWDLAQTMGPIWSWGMVHTGHATL
jgi:hypothetical protein